MPTKAFPVAFVAVIVLTLVGADYFLRSGGPEGRPAFSAYLGERTAGVRGFFGSGDAAPEETAAAEPVRQPVGALSGQACEDRAGGKFCGQRSN